ncbi:hypothetical protein LguiA_029788 [Lonicera macranthoides]
MPKKAQSNDSLHLSPLNPQKPNLYITLTGTFLPLPPKNPNSTRSSFSPFRLNLTTIAPPIAPT